MNGDHESGAICRRLIRCVFHGLKPSWWNQGERWWFLQLHLPLRKVGFGITRRHYRHRFKSEIAARVWNGLIKPLIVDNQIIFTKPYGTRNWKNRNPLMQIWKDNEPHQPGSFLVPQFSDRCWPPTHQFIWSLQEKRHLKSQLYISLAHQPGNYATNLQIRRQNVRCFQVTLYPFVRLYTRKSYITLLCMLLCSTSAVKTGVLLVNRLLSRPKMGNHHQAKRAGFAVYLWCPTCS